MSGKWWGANGGTSVEVGDLCIRAVAQFKDFERFCQRIDIPAVSDTVARVDVEFVGAVISLRRGGQNFGKPVWWGCYKGGCREGRKICRLPSGKVWNNDVFAEVQLGLVEKKPTTGAIVSKIEGA